MDSTTQALLGAMQQQRTHVLGAVEGLSEQDLLRPVLPSGWSCAALVQHLAVDVERFWFRHVVAGEPGLDEEADAWVVSGSPLEALELYRAECALADEVVGRTPLDQPPAWWPAFFGDFRLPDLRAVLLHALTETSCHAGHLDAARELIDGQQWLVLT